MLECHLTKWSLSRSLCLQKRNSAPRSTEVRFQLQLKKAALQAHPGGDIHFLKPISSLADRGNLPPIPSEKGERLFSQIHCEYSPPSRAFETSSLYHTWPGLCTSSVVWGPWFIPHGHGGHPKPGHTGFALPLDAFAQRRPGREQQGEERQEGQEQKEEHQTLQSGHRRTQWIQVRAGGETSHSYSLLLLPLPSFLIATLCCVPTQARQSRRLGSQQPGPGPVEAAVQGRHQRSRDEGREDLAAHLRRHRAVRGHGGGQAGGQPRRSDCILFILLYWLHIQCPHLSSSSYSENNSK